LEVKRRIGYVPETGAIYQTLSVHEYLALVGALHHLPPAEIDRKCRKMLDLFGIGQTSNQRIDTLSKGMRQKVVIISALLHDPEVLLFDEPLSGLDANAARTIRDLVRGLADQGKTILYCSHVLDVVERLCERVIILHQGQKVADGSPSELMAANQRGSLDHVFRELTASSEQEEVAAALLEAVQREKSLDSSTQQPAGTGQKNHTKR
jgi:ABC-2 type transport system ATP-binding protein